MGEIFSNSKYFAVKHPAHVFCGCLQNKSRYKTKKILVVTYVVGMSIEKMWPNDEMTNFETFTQPIPMFFFEVQNWDSQDSAETAAHIT